MSTPTSCLVERAMTATSPDRETLKRKSRAGMRCERRGLPEASIFQFDVGRRDSQFGSEDTAQLPPGSDKAAAVPLQSQPLGAPTFLFVEANADLADDVLLRIEHECQDLQTIILENRHYATGEPVAAAAGVTGREERLIGTAGKQALGVVRDGDPGKSGRSRRHRRHRPARSGGLPPVDWERAWVGTRADC